MEDLGRPPYEPAIVEVWIHRELKNGNQPEYITDQLLKYWEKGQLTFNAKKSVGVFCIRNGFFASLLRLVKIDLRAGAAVAWDQVFELLLLANRSLPKEIADALLTGATRDHQLQALSAQAVKRGDGDPRWRKILNAELKDRLLEAQQQRKKLLEEINIFRHEGMDTEIRDDVHKLLSLFPNDPDGNDFIRSMSEREIEKTLKNTRRAHRPKAPSKLEGEAEPAIDDLFPGLAASLKKLKAGIDLENSYLISIGLAEMGITRHALEVVRWTKKQWTVREKIWELELLVKLELFAEALSAAQFILAENDEMEAMRSALYFQARSLYGLDDLEQAASILRGLVEHDPNYRDAAILLLEWGAGQI